MAINYVISYSFTPSTTISSTQVNTNFSDNAAVWQGLEALTKSFAALKVDGNPATALEVAPKQYVDLLMAYRRPTLTYGSATTVAVESGLDGTSGDIPMLFPDGSMRIETSTARTTFNITRNAVLTTSGAQSGLTGATSEAVNTAYALYAVKVTDSSTLWVTVGSTVVPTQANYATLNTAYGTSGWVYLGMIWNGDNASATGDIASFTMSGNTTLFTNACGGTGAGQGIQLTSATATSVTYTYSAGVTAGKIPTHLKHGIYSVGKSYDAAAKGARFVNAAGTIQYGLMLDSAENVASIWRATLDLASGIQAIDLNSGSGNAWSVYLAGFMDPVLGVGSNPLL